MQLNPINAVGFKGVRTDNYTYGEQKTSDMINDAINSYAATIREKQQDVHNTTLIAALLTAGASIMAGRKFTDGKSARRYFDCETSLSDWYEHKNLWKIRRWHVE